MSRACLFASLGLVAMCAVSIVHAADDAQSVFDSIYGAKLKIVASTPSTADDVELAKSLLDAARSAGSTPDFQLLLLKNAAELAAKDPAGFDTAIAARKLEADIKPDLKPAALEAIAAIQQRRYNTAKTADKPAAGELLLDALLDEAAAKSDDAEASQQIYRKAVSLAGTIKSPRQSQIKAIAEAAQSRGRITARIAELKAKLKANSADKVSGRELVMIHFVTLDSPEQARQFTFLTDDTDLTAHVTLANTDPAGLTDAQCMDMGEWYRKLADTEYVAKLPLLARAGGYYQRYLELHSAADLERTKATLALKSIRQTLDAAKVEIRPLGLAAASPATPSVTPAAAEPRIGEWFDLLKLVDPARDAFTGTWKREDAGLTKTGQDRDTYPRLTLPVLPAGDYDMQVTFVRQSGGNNVGVIFPVGAGVAQLVLGGWNGNDTSGLQDIDGVNVVANATTSHLRLENGMPYTADIHVRLRQLDADILIEVNQKPFVRWTGRQSSLGPNVNWKLPSAKTPGLAVDCDPTTFSAAKLRMLSGKATLLRDPAAATALSSGAWTDLLAAADPNRDAIKGSWAWVPGGVTNKGAAEWEILGFPGAAPAGAYEFEVNFKRTAGDDTLMFAFPAGTGKGQLVLSAWHGVASTLAIRDADIRSNSASVRPGTLENNHAYNLRIRVVPEGDDVAVNIELDGKPYSQFRGPQTKLQQLGPAWIVGSAFQFAVGAQGSSHVLIASARVRPLNADGSATAAATGEWTDLLKTADTARNAIKGDWKLDGGKLMSNEASQHDRFTFDGDIRGPYDLQARFTRNSGDGDIAFFFPVGAARAHIALSAYSGELSAFFIRGTEFRTSPAVVRPGRLENGHEYTLDLHIVPDGTNAAITVMLDGKPYLAWNGAQADLATHYNWPMPPERRFALGTYSSTATFTALRYRGAGSAAPTAAGQWTDLLKTADIARNVVAGNWKMDGGQLRVAAGDSARLTFDGDVRGAYDMEMRFTRHTGRGDVTVIFPAGNKMGQFILSGAKGAVSGLCMQGFTFTDTPVGVRPGTLDNEHDYTLGLHVVPDGANVAITATLDGKPYLAWAGPQSKLRVHEFYAIPADKQFALGAGSSDVTFAGFRYRAAEASPRSDAGGPWTDLLKLVDLDKHAFKSRENWTRDASGALTTAYGDQQAPSRDVMLPLAPDGSYELQVKFTRNQGIDTPYIYLPVGSGHTQFIFSSFGGQCAGLATINGVHVTQQDDALKVHPAKLTNGQEYTADFRVIVKDQDADITVRLDGKDYFHWQGPQSALGGRVPPDIKAIGLATWKSSATFSVVKVRPLGGVLRPVAEKPR